MQLPLLITTLQDFFVNDFGRWGLAKQTVSSCDCFNVLYDGIALLWTPTLCGPGFNKVPKVLRENAVWGLKGVSLQASHHMNTEHREPKQWRRHNYNAEIGWSMLVNPDQCANLSLSLASLKLGTMIYKKVFAKSFTVDWAWLL